jgi:thiol-disulfide isomerase/thioredoxin
MDKKSLVSIPTLMVFVDGKAEYSLVGGRPLGMLEKELGAYIWVETKDA